MVKLIKSNLAWLIFWLAYILIRLTCILTIFNDQKRKSKGARNCLAIEAGSQGWNSIEFKELYYSASEYFGADSIVKVDINKSFKYLPQVKKVLTSNQLTHYLYDPRTGRQDLWGAFVESISIAILFARFKVIPIVYLTDLSVRLWRCQAAAVSAVSGVVVTFMMPRLVKPIFPHNRMIGPSLMPFSLQTLDYLQRINITSNRKEKVVRFTGSLYEPRTTFLNNFKRSLNYTGHVVEIMGRELGSPRVDDEEYWRRIYCAEIVITTADQAIQDRTDWTWIPHLVYRYLEVLAAGSLLLAPEVPGISRYFVPNKHFVAYGSLEEAVEKARFYLENPKELDIIREAGHKKACELINTHTFWMQIDTALSSKSIF